MTAPLLEVAGVGKRFGGFVALDAIDLAVAPRRAARPDRAERLGQEHAGQLHLRHAAQRQRQRALRRPAAGRARRAPAHAARPGAQLPAAAAVRQPDASPRISASRSLYTVNARAGTHLSPAAIDARCRELLRHGRAGRQGGPPAARPDADRDAQARARARHGRRAQAADRRRGDGRACRMPRSTRSWRCCSGSTSAGVTVIMIEHIMRAVMEFSQRLVVLVAGRKIADGDAAGRGAQPRGREGLSWRVASPSPASTPATARCACCDDVSLRGRRRRDGGAARHQRQRQEHADEMRHGHRAADAPAASPPRSTASATSWSGCDRGDRRSRHRASCPKAAGCSPS